MSKQKLILKVKDEHYQIFSHYTEEEQFVYCSFIVTKHTTPYFIYQLGITRVALSLYNYKKAFDPSEWLFEQGTKMVREMIEKGEIRSSGMITSWEMSQQHFDWNKLECIDSGKQYTQ